MPCLYRGRCFSIDPAALIKQRVFRFDLSGHAQWSFHASFPTCAFSVFLTYTLTPCLSHLTSFSLSLCFLTALCIRSRNTFHARSAGLQKGISLEFLVCNTSSFVLNDPFMFRLVASGFITLYTIHFVVSWSNCVLKYIFFFFPFLILLNSNITITISESESKMIRLNGSYKREEWNGIMFFVWME